MAKTFSYDPTGAGYYNRIEMSGGTESDPITFDDLVAADRAGTLKLLDGVIDADPDVFSFDFQVQQVELRALQLSITCTPRAGATVDIAGKDFRGNAISENSIDVSSGSATTNKYFSEIDSNGITVRGLQVDDEFDIDQSQWGVIWDYSECDTYLLDAWLYIGDNTTPTYFKDLNKNIVFRDGIGYSTIFSVKGNAVLQLGEVEDEATKATKNGCSIHVMDVYSYAVITCSHSASSALLFYDCRICSPYVQTSIWLYNGRMWNCQLSKRTVILVWLIGENSADISRLTSNRGRYDSGSQLDLRSTPTVEDAKLTGGYYGIDMSNFDATVRNLYMARQGYAAVYIHTGAGGYTKSLKLIDTFIDVWKIYKMTGNPGEVLRQYSCNIRVADKNGADLSGATVTCKDKNDNIVFSVATDVNGDIAEQIITYQRWSDPEGTYPTYATEDDAEKLSPHKFIIEKTGYETLELEEITVNEPINWHLELQDPVAVCDYPSEDDVEKDVVYDSGNKTGDFHVPEETEVKKDIGYGAAGTEFLGTLEAGALLRGTNLLGQLEAKVNLEAMLDKSVNLVATLQRKVTMTGTLREEEAKG